MRTLCITLLLLAGAGASVAQVPEWYSTHSHPQYPGSEFIIGIGSGNGPNGADAAKKSALSDIVSQLRVQIQSEMRSVTESFAVNDDEQIYSDFKRQSRTMVSDEVTGAEVAVTVTDKGTGTVYMLVVLDRGQYSAALRSQLESGWKQATDLRNAAAGFFAKGKLTEAVQSIGQIKQVIAPLFAQQVLHNAAAGAPYSSPSVFNPAALQNDLRTFLSQIVLQKKSGDGQSGKIGKKLAEPVTVRVLANNVPVSGVPVQFFIDQKSILGEAVTDADGAASFSTVFRSGPGLKARLSLPGIGREFEQNLTASSVQFGWTAQASDKAFAISVNTKNAKVEQAVAAKLSTAVSQIGYSVVTMSPFTIAVDIQTGVPSTIDGMAGTLYNVTVTATVSVKDNAKGTILGTESFSAKGVGSSEQDAVLKGAAGLKFDQGLLSELLQR
ncbi:MAG: LPP20 family lipoprotein [Bacteroidetes bacterium]|nr:LPP20 family lipoprotein [Bacteroidota bacterium]